MIDYTFDVIGTPRPQGSTRALTNQYTGKATVVHVAPKGLAQWRTDIKEAAQQACQFHETEPIAIWAQFRVERPASVSVKKRPDPTVTPDIDKFARALLDALTSVLYRDDAQVVDLHARKRYCDPGEGPGVRVQITVLGGGQK